SLAPPSCLIACSMPRDRTRDARRTRSACSAVRTGRVTGMGRRSVVSAGAGATGPLLRGGGLDMSRTPGRHRRGRDRPAGPIIRGRDRGSQTAAPARLAVDLSRARVLASKTLMAPRRITFIGVPLDLGARPRGVVMGPSAFRLADIHQKVRELGYEVAEAGDMEALILETREPGHAGM